MRIFLSFLKLVMVPAIIGVAIWLSGIREIYAVILRSSFGIIVGAFALSMLAVGLTAVAEAREYAVPVAERQRQIPPGTAGSSDPQHGLDK